MKISVVVPAYNAQDTLTACLASLLAQSLDDMEIIVVDDGSTDDTVAILDGLAAAHARIRAFHQPNGGGSVARNRGLDEARGDYITFVDADDVLEECLASLHSEAVAQDADVLFFGWIEQGKVRREHPWPPEAAGYWDSAGIGPWLPRCAVSLSACCKLYRRALLAGLRFTPGVAIAEDMLFSIQAIGRAARFAVAPQAFYAYVQRGGSAIHRYRPDRAALALRTCRAAATLFPADYASATPVHDCVATLYGNMAMEVAMGEFLPGCPHSLWQKAVTVFRFLGQPAFRQGFLRACRGARLTRKQRALRLCVRLYLVPVMLLWARGFATRRAAQAED
ncbi:MAG: glycosyltransferase [Oscillospiraceae bacterium]|nr:glycosyltransferase [Oscillospiraceae bacterium]